MANHNEQAIEKEIQAKGLNAPRLNPAHIDAQIVGEQYHVFPKTTLTVCALTLQNGFIVTGESASASAANFDQGLGRKIAREFQPRLRRVKRISQYRDFLVLNLGLNPETREA